MPEILEELKLAALDAYPTPSPDAVRVVMRTCKPTECQKGDVVVAMRGELYADTIEATAALLGNDLRELHDPGLRVALLVDGRVAWRSIAPIIGAIGSAGVQHVSLAFAAGEVHATPPAPSSIDAQLTAFDAKEDADLERDPGGTLARTMARKGPPEFVAAVYKNCPQASQLLGDILSERVPSDDKIKAIAEKLPDAVVTCNCKIEIHALERLIWRLIGGDTSHPIAWVPVELAKGGARFDAAATATWSTMHAELVAAARRPLAFE